MLKMENELFKDGMKVWQVSLPKDTKDDIKFSIKSFSMFLLYVSNSPEENKYKLIDIDGGSQSLFVSVAELTNRLSETCLYTDELSEVPFLKHTILRERERELYYKRVIAEGLLRNVSKQREVISVLRAELNGLLPKE